MNNTLLRDAVRAAIGVGVVATLTVSPTAFAQPEDPAQLGRIITTGTRISRLDVEAARPITVISREDIERSGQPTVADVLRNTTFNSFGEYRETSGNNFAGQALVGLKGLGSTRTLVLLNGRRLPRSPVTSDQGVDLNSIPLEAIDRIEILSDSASAIYGSDAIGGVINIILRDDFEGVSFMGTVARPTQAGADSEATSVVFGSSSARGNFIVAAERYSKDIIYSRDRSYTAPDYGDGVNFGTVAGISPYGNTFVDYANFNAVADPNCDSVVDPTTGEPLFAGIYSSGSETYCTYAYAAVAAETQAIDRNSLFVNASYEITPNITATYTGTYSQVEAFGRYAAAVGGFDIDFDDPAVQAIAPQQFIDDFAGIDGFGTPYDGFLVHRFVGVGPRDDHNTNYLFDNQLNLTGTAGRFDWDFGIGVTKYTGKELGFNYVKTSTVEQLVSAGVYNPFDPLNPDNEEAYGQMRHTNTRDIDTNFKRVQGTVSFDAGELPAGPLGWAVGFEWNDQSFRDIYDPDREAQDVIGSGGNTASGKRQNYAVFSEVLVPVTTDLEVSVAARYDHYDDSAGSETSPYVALRYRPSEDWLVRASWGQGFRAANMYNLYSAVAFSAEPLTDITYCRDNNIADCPDDTQVDTFSGGNPDLIPEHSESFNVGFAFNRGNFNMSADYWNVDIQDGITTQTATGVIELEYNGLAFPPGVSITRAPALPGEVTGSIQRCAPGQTTGCGMEYGWLNLAKTDYTGIDLRLDYRVPLQGSELNFRYVHSHLLEALEQTTPVSPVDDLAGEQDSPAFRSVLVTEWDRGPHTFTWILNYIDSYTNTVGETIGSNLINDVQYTYDITANGRLTIGVRNIADEDPPLDPCCTDSSQPFFSDLYNMDGRIPYVTYRHAF
jgi:iron complex outermembrane receptor protein